LKERGMSDQRPAGEETEQFEEEAEEVCTEQHLADLDDQAKAFLSTFTTIRSKISDLERAESDLKRFELSIESERKRLVKQLDGARLALRNARIQVAVELQKVDEIGFTKFADMVKEMNRA
jgi:septal ring factor EnvC (AmiA/AmiB activator)